MFKIRRIDHIGIAVRDLKKAMETMTDLLGAELICIKDLKMSGNNASAAYMKLGESIIVLDEASQPGGFLEKFIQQRGEGLHHVGVEIDDLDDFIESLQKKGVRIPAKSLEGDFRREVLLSPKEALGVVWQVIQWQDGSEKSVQERVDRIRQFDGVVDS
ncbi:MAG: VOC family protein [Candidatus Tectomicrobia bacterium]|uniref:VOC family protein n=1 Tax=Tectimicrobiota bacterium TaxID=2528274 RepID=A0A933LQS3_UNCTE|nr:VOC family protein [Candidatus Tectomicrobia bacterium]